MNEGGPDMPLLTQEQIDGWIARRDVVEQSLKELRAEWVDLQRKLKAAAVLMEDD